MSSRKTTIRSLKNSDKKKLLVPIPAIKLLEPKTKNIDIAMIGADVQCAVCYLNRAQVFAVSIKNKQYPIKKIARAETYPKSVIPLNTTIFLMFSQKKTQTLFLYIKNMIIRFIQKKNRNLVICHYIKYLLKNQMPLNNISTFIQPKNSFW